MKSKKLKLLVVPIAVASASVIGMVSGTLAYFTSVDKASVSIEAGQVKVDVSLSNLKTYSLDVLQKDAAPYTFENGGTASIEGTAITLSKITPGDKVTFDLKVKNMSNVDMKYKMLVRYANEVAGADPHDPTSTGYLSDVLEIEGFSMQTTYKTELKNTYDTYIVNDQVSIEFPKEAGNEYQNASSTIYVDVEAVQNNKPRNQEYGFFDSYKDGNTWVHEVSTKAEFQNIIKNLAATYSDTTINDKTATYRILNDIDFGGDAYAGLENASTLLATPFTGNLVGAGVNNGGVVTLSNFGVRSLAPEEAAEREFFGLFQRAYYASFSNLTLSGVVLDDSKAKGSGLILGGVAGTLAEAEGTYVKFKNITIDPTCSLNGNSGLGSFAGYLRSIQDVEFINCVNYANVTTSGHSAGGFSGSLSTANGPEPNYRDKTFILKNCANYGNIKAGGANLGYAGGFFAQCQGNSHTHWTLINVANYGNITSTSSDIASPIFSYRGCDAEATAGDTFVINNINNTGMIIKNTTNPTAEGFGLKSNSALETSPILANGQTVTRAQFFNLYVMSNGTATFPLSGAYKGSDASQAFNTKEITVDLSSATDEFKAAAKKIAISYNVQSCNIEYATNTGAAASGGYPSIYTKEITIDTWSDQLSIPRLIYIGQNYGAGKTEPMVYYIPDDPTSFRYDFGYYYVEPTAANRGFHVLSDGSASFVRDNSGVTSGTYYLTQKFPTTVMYTIDIMMLAIRRLVTLQMLI